MNALLDIVISVAVGALVLSMLVTFNSNLVQQGIAQTVRLGAQTDLTTATDVLEFSLRKMGYRVPVGSDSAIVYADSNKIKFKGDFDNDGSVDTLTYYLSPTARTGNANQNTKMFYRTLNAQSAQFINLGITKFKVWYYDGNGNPFTSYPVSRPSQIKSLKVALNVESTVSPIISTEKYVTLNPGVYWERTIKPNNMK